MLPDVAQVKPVVQSTNKGVSVTLNVEIAPGIDALEKSNQIRQTARRVLEEQLGLEIREEIRVVLKPSSFPKLPAGAQMPPVVAEAIGKAPAAQPAVETVVVSPPPAGWDETEIAGDVERWDKEPQSSVEEQGEEEQGGETESGPPPEEG
jgi:hypothetical protein